MTNPKSPLPWKYLPSQEDVPFRTQPSHLIDVPPRIVDANGNIVARFMRDEDAQMVVELIDQMIELGKQIASEEKAS